MATSPPVKNVLFALVTAMSATAGLGPVLLMLHRPVNLLYVGAVVFILAALSILKGRTYARTSPSRLALGAFSSLFPCAIIGFFFLLSYWGVYGLLFAFKAHLNPERIAFTVTFTLTWLIILIPVQMIGEPLLRAADLAESKGESADVPVLTSRERWILAVVIGGN